jgi:hypothetical protein
MQLLAIVGEPMRNISMMSNDELMFWSDFAGKNAETLQKWR